jgi:DNA uptake protein ComE-like DNA-binding protein
MKSFFAGISLGLAAGLLLAPKSGGMTRAELRRRAQRWRRDLSNSLKKWTQPREKRAGARKPRTSAEPTGILEDVESAAHSLNTATREALIAVHGIGQVLADRIVQNRPYKKAYEVVEKGILPESTFAELRRELLEKSA